jgi:hypothetical protein
VEELPNLGKREAATARHFIAFVVEQTEISRPPTAGRSRERAFVGISECGNSQRNNPDPCYRWKFSKDGFLEFGSPETLSRFAP